MKRKLRAVDSATTGITWRRETRRRADKPCAHPFELLPLLFFFIALLTVWAVFS